jgi:hypothetical protein
VTLNPWRVSTFGGAIQHLPPDDHADHGARAKIRSQAAQIDWWLGARGSTIRLQLLEEYTNTNYQ